MNSAVRMVRQGRGYGITDVPVIDLAFIGTGGTWHIVSDGKPLCNRRGSLSPLEEGLDPRVVLHKGFGLCFTCCASLGEVPMPALIKEPPQTEEEE